MALRRAQVAAALGVEAGGARLPLALHAVVRAAADFLPSSGGSHATPRGARRPPRRPRRRGGRRRTTFILAPTPKMKGTGSFPRVLVRRVARAVARREPKAVGETRALARATRAAPPTRGDAEHPGEAAAHTPGADAAKSSAMTAPLSLVSALTNLRLLTCPRRPGVRINTPPSRVRARARRRRRPWRARRGDAQPPSGAASDR